MRAFYRAGAWCALAVLGVAASASAATIDHVQDVAFDPTLYGFLEYGYGSGAYYLTWSAGLANPVSGLFNPGGEPGPGLPAGGQGPSNPPELNFIFEQVSGGGGGGGGAVGGGGAGLGQSLYTIGSNVAGQPWSMIFSMLFYDPGFAEEGSVLVELFGTEGGLDSRTLTAAQIRAGIMLTWDLGAAGDEEVKILVTPSGDVTYPAGFFMDNANFNGVIPEPASLGLMALGLAGFLGRRRK
jgi:hypothetical protein